MKIREWTCIRCGYIGNSKVVHSKVHHFTADVYINGVHSRPVARISVHATHPAEDGLTLWTPNSGAETSLIGLEAATSLNICQQHLQSLLDSSLYANRHQPLACVGTFPAGDG